MIIQIEMLNIKIYLIISDIFYIKSLSLIFKISFIFLKTLKSGFQFIFIIY